MTARPLSLLSLRPWVFLLAAMAVAPVRLAFGQTGSAAAALREETSAGSDELGGTKFDGLMVERSHVIKLRLRRGYAELTATRTVYNGGDRHDQAVYSLSVPAGAVANDLRTLGLRNGRPYWYRADLLEAEAAAARYQEPWL